MDFITELPQSNSFDCIFVVMNRLTKMAHFVPYKKTSSSEDTAKLFLDNVYRYHSVPDDIVSDRDTQFVSKFWRSLFEILKVDTKLSSALHPQTDGQTERVNEVLEQYLRCSINYQQEDMTAYLPLAEFACNNTLYASTQQTPFFSNHGYHPKLDVLSPSTNNNPAAEKFTKHISELQATLKLQLQTTQESYKATSDKFQNEAPVFKIGDKVWLLRRNIKTK